MAHAQAVEAVAQARAGEWESAHSLLRSAAESSLRGAGRVNLLLLPAELGTTPRGGERLLIPHRRSPAPPSPRAVTGEPHPLEGSPDRAREQSASTIGPFRVITAGAKNSALFLAAKPRRVTRLPHTFHVVHDRHRGPAPPLERLSRLYPPRMRPRRPLRMSSCPEERRAPPRRRCHMGGATLSQLMTRRHR